MRENTMIKKKEILKKYIEIVIYVEQRTFEEFGDPDFFKGMHEQAISIARKEQQKPRIAQTRHLVKDGREHVDALTRCWSVQLLDEIESKFGKLGTNFRNNKFILNDD